MIEKTFGIMIYIRKDGTIISAFLNSMGVHLVITERVRPNTTVTNKDLLTCSHIPLLYIYCRRV